MSTSRFVDAVCALLVATSLLICPARGEAKEEAQTQTLGDGFQNPPQAAWPRVWWHWINGNVNAEGAKLDLEWMQRIGVGGVHTFTGALPGPIVVPKRAPFLSPEWKTAFRKSVLTARAAGMEFGIAGSPGWSETGGPWVSAEDGMKKYVWSETHVRAGQRFDGQLVEPPSVTGPFLAIKGGRSNARLYQDAYVVAFPTPKGESEQPVPVLRTSSPSFDPAPLLGNGIDKPLKLALEEGQEFAWIEARYPRPITLAAVSLGLPSGAKVELQVPVGSGSYRTIASTLVKSADELSHPAPRQTFAFPANTAMVFRLKLSPVSPPPGLQIDASPPIQQAAPRNLQLTQLRFENGARINRFEEKAGFQPAIEIDGRSTPPVERNFLIPLSGVIDLTAKLGKDGRLDWNPPPGNWTIMRFGWSLTGQTNGPADPEATGLEVDKLDAAAVRRYLTEYLAIHDRALGSSAISSGLTSLLTDSWEAGVQNWSPNLLADFRSRRGYEPLPYLPALAGRVVESAAQSDRFLWDFRLTLKELVADNHHGVLAEMLQARGITYYTEAQGDTPRVIADGMTLKSRSDIPTAEYWYRPFAAGPGQNSLKADLEEAASAAHVYGRKFAAAEALTVAAPADPWAFSPRMLKPVADEIFARGINRILVHDSVHQPLVDSKPGLMMMVFGQFFNRNDTWAEDAKPWVDYLSRTSYLLQQGKYIADIAYFYGQEQSLSEQFRARSNTDVPAGYRYDYINPEALLTLLEADAGEIATPSGMRYRLLLIPPQVTRMSLPALTKIRKLVIEGAVVAGRKPVSGLGLASPDEEIERLAREIWGDGQSGGNVHRFGKGRVYRDLASALSSEGITPDFQYSGARDDGTLLTLHRRTEDADIYFITNQGEAPLELQATFRVSGTSPQLWRAETGARTPLSYRRDGEKTIVPLSLAPNDAVFVVFEGAAPAAERIVIDPRRETVTDLNGSWDVSFQSNRGAPEKVRFNSLRSWTEMPEFGVRYFSGSATYRQTVRIPAARFDKSLRYVLQLGTVRELAAVTVNGKAMGMVWHAPYDLDITSALRPGANAFEIRVVNLWPNRIIGDRQPGAAVVAFAPQANYTANSPLLSSGLLGPVSISSVQPPTSTNTARKP